jgi:hypothetical protein
MKRAHIGEAIETIRELNRSGAALDFERVERILRWAAFEAVQAQTGSARDALCDVQSTIRGLPGAIIGRRKVIDSATVLGIIETRKREVPV